LIKLITIIPNLTKPSLIMMDIFLLCSMLSPTFKTPE